MTSLWKTAFWFMANCFQLRKCQQQSRISVDGFAAGFMQCFFAMVFTAAALSVFHMIGLMQSDEDDIASSPANTFATLNRDLRYFLSFVVGVAVSYSTMLVKAQEGFLHTLLHALLL
mmetsp:Transcript_106630/g.206592  ORF Transcript_106630/g.206592 Transcript_106630/m.206592 type:complete len:117 (+) Transcript_106630:46-396(+)